jgi:hypothetical protein
VGVWAGAVADGDAPVLETLAVADGDDDAPHPVRTALAMTALARAAGRMASRACRDNLMPLLRHVRVR